MWQASNRSFRDEMGKLKYLELPLPLALLISIVGDASLSLLFRPFITCRLTSSIGNQHAPSNSRTETTPTRRLNLPSPAFLHRVQSTLPPPRRLLTTARYQGIAVDLGVHIRTSSPSLRSSTTIRRPVLKLPSDSILPAPCRISLPKHLNMMLRRW